MATGCKKRGPGSNRRQIADAGRIFEPRSCRREEADLTPMVGRAVPGAPLDSRDFSGTLRRARDGAPYRIRLLTSAATRLAISHEGDHIRQLLRREHIFESLRH